MKRKPCVVEINYRRMKSLLSLLLIHLLFTACETTQEEKPLYLNQAPPTTTPVVFAPGLISQAGEYEFGSVFNQAGTEFYYGVDVGGNSEIRYSELVEGHWTKPATLLSHPDYGFNDPFLSPDEQRLYFISIRPTGERDSTEDYNIWYVERTENGWSEPINPGPGINTDKDEYYISFTQDGTMYFSSNQQAPEGQEGDFDIYASAMEGGEFQPAVRLGDAINTSHYEADVFIDPAEAYIIFCANRPDGLGRGDLYISYKNADGSWTPSQNMGEVINTEEHELCPFVSSDGKYFFYTSNQDIYWVSTDLFLQDKARKNR